MSLQVLSREAFHDLMTGTELPFGTVLQAWAPVYKSMTKHRITAAADMPDAVIERQQAVHAGQGQEFDTWQKVEHGTPEYNFFNALANSLAALVAQTCALKAITAVFATAADGAIFITDAAGVCAADDAQSLASEAWRERLSASEGPASPARPMSAPHQRHSATRPRSPMLAHPGRIRPASAVDRPRTAAELGSMHNQSLASLNAQKTTRSHKHIPLDREKLDASGRPLDAQEKHEFVSDFLERIASSEHTLLRTTQRPESRESDAAAHAEEDDMVAPLDDMSDAAWERRRQAALACLREENMKLFAVTVRADAAIKRLFSVIGLVCDGKTMPWQAAMKHLKQSTAFIDKLHAVQPGTQEKGQIIAALELIGNLKTWNPDVLSKFSPTAGHLAHWAIVAAFQSACVAGIPIPEALQ